MNPPEDITFEDDSPVESVGFSGFDYDAIDRGAFGVTAPEESEPKGRAVQLDSATLLLELKDTVARAVCEIITSGANYKIAGQRAFALKARLKCGGHLTQQALSEQMGVSIGTVNALLKKVTTDFDRINIIDLVRQSLEKPEKLNIAPK